MRVIAISWTGAKTVRPFSHQFMIWLLVYDHACVSLRAFLNVCLQACRWSSNNYDFFSAGVSLSVHVCAHAFVLVCMFPHVYLRCVCMRLLTYLARHLIYIWKHMSARSKWNAFTSGVHVRECLYVCRQTCHWYSLPIRAYWFDTFFLNSLRSRWFFMENCLKITMS